jgi:Pre-PUA-like domain
MTEGSRERISLLTLDNEVLFFQHFDENYIPSLRLVHKCMPEFRKLTQTPTHSLRYKSIAAQLNLYYLELI